MCSDKTRTTIAVIYRQTVLGVLYAITIIGYQYLYPNQHFNVLNFLLLNRYLTVATFASITIYFSTATLFQLCNFNALNSYFYTIVFTFGLAAMLIHWLVFITNPNFMNTIPDLKNLPTWYNHIYSSIGPVLLLIDVLIWRPKRVRLLISLAVTSTLVIAYMVYIEVVILKHAISIYPKLDTLPYYYRYPVYCGVLLSISLINLLAYLLVRLLSQNEKLTDADEESTKPEDKMKASD
ncbi:hypothetical protein MN116_000230 [Schistosoma mekongi]|uniref:FAR-17a/AIG1-like protein n=1 Tax=Schistosoma mekongi TaxID=38744 RepID=A0AAE1Z5H4_SCHME|nr:hypothetical protein MN116_000230 [Schistosoma mekongi]